MTSVEQPPKGTGELLKCDRQKLWKGPCGGVLWAGSIGHGIDLGNTTGLLTSSLLNKAPPLTSVAEILISCWLRGWIKKWNSSFHTGLSYPPHTELF